MTDLKAEEAVRTTDMAPLSKKIYKRLRCSIELTDSLHVTIRSHPDDKPVINEVHTIDNIVKRFRPGELVRGKKFFFLCHVSSTINALEIGDRLPKDKEW